MHYIPVKVVLKSSNTRVVEKEGIIYCYISKPPINNQANKEVIKLLSKYLKVPKSCLVIRRGVKSRIKYIENIC